MDSGGAYRRFMAMTHAERDAEVGSYDREMLDPGKPLTPAQRALVQRATRRGPAKAAAAKRMQVALDPALLAAATRYAKDHGRTRSDLVAEGLRLVLGRKA